jgi:hypothetical protein
VRRGVSSDGRGKAQWLGVPGGKLTIFVVGGGWWDRLHFSTRQSKSNDPLGRNHGKYDNQMLDDGVWAETVGGWRGGFVFLRGFLINFSAGGGNKQF